jgi:predicted nucleic acid-binding protein
LSVVLDCSIAIAWLMPDEAAPEAEQVIARAMREGAYVPALFSLEVANVLLVNARRERIPPSTVAAALTDLRTLNLRQDPAASNDRLDEVIVLAERHGLTSYDAAYLELARRLDVELATLDRPLRLAAREAGVKLFAP